MCKYTTHTASLGIMLRIFSSALDLAAFGFAMQEECAQQRRDNGLHEHSCLAALSLRRDSVLQNTHIQDIAHLVNIVGITELDLSNNMFQYGSLRTLADHLCNSTNDREPRLQTIKLSHIELKKDIREAGATVDDPTTFGTQDSWDCSEVADLVHKCPNLKSIELQKNILGDSCVFNVMSAASFYGPRSPLREVRLANNAVSDEGASAIADAIRRGVRLSWLGMGHNLLTSVGVNEMVTANKSNARNRNGLQELDVGKSSIGNNGAETLGLALRDSKGVEKLSLYDCNIQEAGAAALLSSLVGYESLQWLLLADNRIGKGGMEALVRAITYKSEEKGARNQDGYFFSSALQVVDISNNALSDVEGKILLDALKLSPNLNVEQIFISGNGFSEGLYKELVLALKDQKEKAIGRNKIVRGKGDEL
jgi:Ran GTPase-activating protein (RanGAP) involved in mRNA processing and transport